MPGSGQGQLTEGLNCWLGMRPLSRGQQDGFVAGEVPWSDGCLVFFVFFVLFLLFRTTPAACGSPQARGWSWRCQPTPQPQQCGIRAASATYTRAHSNSGSSNPQARPGIKPASSSILVGLVTTAPQQELPRLVFEKPFLSALWESTGGSKTGRGGDQDGDS